MSMNDDLIKTTNELLGYLEREHDDLVQGARDCLDAIHINEQIRHVAAMASQKVPCEEHELLRFRTELRQGILDNLQRAKVRTAAESPLLAGDTALAVLLSDLGEIMSPEIADFASSIAQRARRIDGLMNRTKILCKHVSSHDEFIASTEELLSFLQSEYDDLVQNTRNRLDMVRESSYLRRIDILFGSQLSQDLKDELLQLQGNQCHALQQEEEQASAHLPPLTTEDILSHLLSEIVRIAPMEVGRITSIARRARTIKHLMKSIRDLRRGIEE